MADQPNAEPGYGEEGYYDPWDLLGNTANFIGDIFQIPFDIAGNFFGANDAANAVQDASLDAMPSVDNLVETINETSDTGLASIQDDFTISPEEIQSNLARFDEVFNTEGLTDEDKARLQVERQNFLNAMESGIPQAEIDSYISRAAGTGGNLKTLNQFGQDMGGLLGNVREFGQGRVDYRQGQFDRYEGIAADPNKLRSDVDLGSALRDAESQINTQMKGTIKGANQRAGQRGTGFSGKALMTDIGARQAASMGRTGAFQGLHKNVVGEGGLRDTAFNNLGTAQQGLFGIDQSIANLPGTLQDARNQIYSGGSFDPMGTLESAVNLEGMDLGVKLGSGGMGWDMLNQAAAPGQQNQNMLFQGMANAFFPGFFPSGKEGG